MSIFVQIALVFYALIATVGGGMLVYNLFTRRGPERSDTAHWIRLCLLFVPVIQGWIFGQQLAYLMHATPRP